MIFQILPISILSFIWIFTLLLASLPDETELHANCSKPFQCANIQNIGYPFWGGDRSKFCGHPNFELNCENKEYSQITTKSSTYRVLSINSMESSLTVVQSEFWDSFCPSTPSNATLDTSYLTYASSSENLTLYYGCSLPSSLFPMNQLDCHQGGSNTTSFYWTHRSNTFILNFEACRTNVLVQVNSTSAVALSSNPPSINISTALRSGFELVWDVNNDDCIKCVQSGGICGSNPNSASFSFSCFCSDQTYEVSCNDSEKGVEKEIGRSSMKIKSQAAITGVCSIIGLLLLIIVFWCFRKVVTKEISKRRKKKFFKQNGGLLLQQQLFSSDCKVEKIKVFKSYELENATNRYNVDRVLGQGGQGTVYKGILPDGKVIAVKKSKIVDPSNVGQFVNEVVILSQVNHRNIVKLLGCCLETEVPMLVYEFISNGTLYQHIQNPKEEFRFTWEMRLRIAAEIAGTLSYLHNTAPVPIYHRDIKSTNILLDDKYQAKVSDFGISRSVNIDISHLTTLVRGTFGYLDPEYYQSSQFTEKSDVYSFGVVLVELLTGREPIFFSTSQEFKKGLAPHFMESMEENHLLDMIDPQLSEEDKIEEMVEVAHLAKACLNSIRKRRPTMKEVTVQLEGIRMSREQTMSRENDGIDHGKAYDSSTSTGVWSETESSATSSLNVDISIEIKESSKIL